MGMERTMQWRAFQLYLHVWKLATKTPQMRVRYWTEANSGRVGTVPLIPMFKGCRQASQCRLHTLEHLLSRGEAWVPRHDRCAHGRAHVASTEEPKLVSSFGSQPAPLDPSFQPVPPTRSVFLASDWSIARQVPFPPSDRPDLPHGDLPLVAPRGPLQMAAVLVVFARVNLFGGMGVRRSCFGPALVTIFTWTPSKRSARASLAYVVHGVRHVLCVDEDRRGGPGPLEKRRATGTWRHGSAAKAGNLRMERARKGREETALETHPRTV